MAQNSFDGDVDVQNDVLPSYYVYSAKDSVPPFISFFEPSNSESLVSLERNFIRLKVSEPIVLINGTLRLYREEDCAFSNPIVNCRTLVQTVNMSDKTNTTVLLAASSQLPAGTGTELTVTLVENALRHERVSFFVELDGGAFQDVANEPNVNLQIVGNSTWRFETDFRSHLRVGQDAEFRMQSGQLQFCDLEGGCTL